MKKFAAFDLEIVKKIPEGCEDWREVAPLGISCAAVVYRLPQFDSIHYQVWSGTPQMTVPEVNLMIVELAGFVKRGYKLVTWNGMGFDFPVVHQEGNFFAACEMLAAGHIDMMFQVVCYAGHYLGLDKAAKGMGLSGKEKAVRLSDGTLLEDMSGSKAPQLWKQGEYEAVIEYLKGDVRETLLLAEEIENYRYLRWNSNRGRRQHISFPKGLLTATECLEVDEPDTSWMTNPPTRQQFLDWMVWTGGKNGIRNN